MPIVRPAQVVNLILLGTLRYLSYTVKVKNNIHPMRYTDARS
jgi:hypothetical protein